MAYNGIKELRAAIADRVAKALPGVQVVQENPWVSREMPLKKTAAVVSIDKVQTRRLALDHYLGEEGREAQQYGQGLTLGLRLDLYDRNSAQNCYELFPQLCQSLMLEDFSPAPESLVCGEAAFDRAAGAFHLVCRGELRGCLGLSHPAASLESFEIRRVTS